MAFSQTKTQDTKQAPNGVNWTLSGLTGDYQVFDKKSDKQISSFVLVTYLSQGKEFKQGVTVFDDASDQFEQDVKTGQIGGYVKFSKDYPASFVYKSQLPF